MSENACPWCGEHIPAAAINVAEGVGLCAACGRLSRLAEIVETDRPMEELLEKPPGGCTVIDRGDGLIIRASLRSLGSVLGALLAALFWNGIVSVFLLAAAANLVGPLPVWFPAPDFDDDMPLGMALFMCVFLIPFIAIGLALIGAVVIGLAGKIDVTVWGSEGSVKTGVGPLRWTKRFDPAAVNRVTLDRTRYMVNDQHRPLIRIHAEKTVRFGSMLPDERRQWMIAALREHLVHRSGSTHVSRSSRWER